MGLLSQSTNLKSLKFTKDRPGGGSSNQPYIKSNIPDSLSGVSTTGGPDFILRGGVLTPKRIIQDTSRLTQMFADTKSINGLLFTAKQNILSRTSVPANGEGQILNDGAYLPTSTILQSAGTPVGLHLNKQGLDPFKGIGKNGGGIFEAFGAKDPLGQPTYLSITKNSPSRLDTWISNSDIFNKDTPLYQYSGGPGSKLGIGKTIIPKLLPKERVEPYSTQEKISKLDEAGVFSFNSFYKDLNKKESSRYNPKTKEDFRQNKPKSFKSVSYINKNIHQRVNLGNPGIKQLSKRRYDYDPQTQKGDNKHLDKITSYNLYKSKLGGLSQSEELNDLVKFRIGVIDNNNPSKKTYIHFRAFLDNMDDSYSADWESFKFMGRGENFYKYNGFDRDVSLAWTVAAQSKGEIIPMYHKLNYLASSLTPDFSPEIGYMRGNLITLTIGGYFYEQPGVITGLNLSVPEESPWEIAINSNGEPDNNVKEVPHIIKVTSFNFKPIHRFTPRIQQNIYDGGEKANKVNKFGKERYINLSKGIGEEHNNYDNNNYTGKIKSIN